MTSLKSREEWKVRDLEVGRDFLTIPGLEDLVARLVKSRLGSAKEEENKKRVSLVERR